MRTVTAIAVAVVMVFTVAAASFAQTTIIPQYTVIPVTNQQQLSSATNHVGDTFQAVCSSNCGGFPSGTVFTGQVVSVTKAASGTPGQIEVLFTRASLPNNTSVSINGTLTSLNRNDVTTDPNTGRLVQKPEVRNQRNKFIAYGAGLGLVIGILSHGNALTGTLIGALAGYLAGITLGKDTKYTDVTVPANTQFGIALTQDVRLPSSVGSGSGSGTGIGTGTGTGTVTPIYTVTFSNLRPYRTTNGVVMVPFRTVMNQIDQSFVYSPSNRSINVITQSNQITHSVGSRMVYIDGSTLRLSAPSRIVNGNLYVPSDFIGVITNETVTWQPSTGTLVIT